MNMTLFSAKSSLSIFTGNKIQEKYHVIFYGKGRQHAKDGHERVHEGQKRGSHAALVPGRMGLLKTGLGHRLVPGF